MPKAAAPKQRSKRARESSSSGPARSRQRKRRTAASENDENSEQQQADEHDNDQPQEERGNEQEVPAIHEGMTQQELYLAGRQLQAMVGDGRQAQQEQHREALADVTNDSNQVDFDEDAAEDAKALRAVNHAGKKLVCTHLLWLPVGYEDQVLESKEDSNYNPLERFDQDAQPENRIQGAFRDILEVLPAEYRDPQDLVDWVGAKLVSAMCDQRAATRNRLRGHPGILGYTDDDFSCSTRRDELFYAHIGGKCDDDGNRSHYDSSDVPALFTDYDEDAEDIDTDKFLFADNLVWIHSAITLGPAATKAIQNSRQPAPGTANAKIWKLRKTTPGMIAGAAIWLRWVLSPDEEFTAIGDHISINWEADFELYLEYLTVGLQEEKECVVELFKSWDKHFYPLSDESTADGEFPEVQESRNALMSALRRSK